MGYTKAALKGISWMGTLRVSTRGLAFLRLAILTRLLTPSQFGTFGIASLVLGFVEILTETGINIFLIQEGAKIEKYINTAWIVSIIRGVLITILICITAPFVTTFFDSTDTLPLLLLISLVPLIRGFINPAIIQFQKELQFNREFWFRFSLFAIDSFVAIVLALLTRDAASFVWGFIASGIVEVFASFLLVRPRPRFVFSFKDLRYVINRGKWMTLAGIFEYLFQHVDDMVVGKILGTGSLGLYQVGYKISTLPISEIADVISRVTFPVYVRISQDRQRLVRGFLRTTFAIFLITIPFGILLTIFGEPLVRIFLGEQWMPVVPALKVLALFGTVRALSNSSAALFLALKRQDIVALLSFLSFAVLAVIIVPLVQTGGIVGAGFAALLSSVIVILAVVYYLFKILA